jgi:hypothetical protein
LPRGHARWPQKHLVCVLITNVNSCRCWTLVDPPCVIKKGAGSNLGGIAISDCHQAKTSVGHIAGTRMAGNWVASPSRPRTPPGGASPHARSTYETFAGRHAGSPSALLGAAGPSDGPTRGEQKLAWGRDARGSPALGSGGTWLREALHVWRAETGFVWEFRARGLQPGLLLHRATSNGPDPRGPGGKAVVVAAGRETCLYVGRLRRPARNGAGLRGAPRRPKSASCRKCTTSRVEERGNGVGAAEFSKLRQTTPADRVVLYLSTFQVRWSRIGPCGPNAACQ